MGRGYQTDLVTKLNRLRAECAEHDRIAQKQVDLSDARRAEADALQTKVDAFESSFAGLELVLRGEIALEEVRLPKAAP